MNEAARKAPDPARVEEVFDRAAELSGDERARYLDDACAGDDDLRREVLELLAHDRPQAAARDRVGRFVIEKKLGEGGMGVVYEARDPELDRKVAIKVVRAELGGGTQGRARLLREAQAMARLAHPNVVPIYEAGSFDGQVFIAMELVLGESLSSWLDRAPRSTREILAMFSAAGRGLAAAHAKGIVHRDFKPENVLVGDDGRPRVVDFGLARASATRPEPHDSKEAISTSSLELDLTAAGAVMGTPRFMSPEQFRSKPVDARSDQWSFAVALYRALFRAAPFEGDDIRALAWSVCTTAASPPPESDVPTVVVEALMRALSTDAADRFATMEELLAEIERPLAEGALDDARTRRGRRVAALALAAGALLTLVGAAFGVPEITPEGLFALALVALVVLAAIGVALRRRLFASAYSRKLALGIAAPVVAFVVHRAAALRFGAPVEVTVVGDSMVVFVMSAMAGALIERWMFVGVALSLAHVALSLAVPRFAGAAFGATLVLYCAAGAWRWSLPDGARKKSKESVSGLGGVSRT